MNGKSDIELMFELKSGQKTALDHIMDRWELPIKAYIYRYTQAPDWVEELAQETFVKVWVNADKFDCNRRFSPWIYTIATNLCRNWKRWRSRHPSVSLSQTTGNDGNEIDLGSKIPSEDTAIPIDIERREACEQVKQHIAELPDALKTTLILYYYQGLSYAEIAESLKCSVRGVETRLYRAKKQLQSKVVRVLAS